ncbi:hypothetical protein B0H19DRAFT_1104482, partial [Mycena capillaripes]
LEFIREPSALRTPSLAPALPSLPGSYAPPPVDEFGSVSGPTLGRTRSASLPPAGPGDAGYGAVGFLPTTLPADPTTPWAQTHSQSLSSSTSSTASTLLPPLQPRAAYGLRSPRAMRALAALDVRRSGVVRLVNSFLATCRDSRGGAGGGSDEKFLDETRFASAHELGMCLRWGLSRVVRVEGGREVRGLLSWPWYERWKGEEGANAYPPTAFSTLLSSLPAQLPPILAPLFALCTKLVAHSNASGHTPPTLAPILAPLLFGLTAPGAYMGAPPTSPGGRGKDKKEAEAEEVLFPTVEDFGGFAGRYELSIPGTAKFPQLHSVNHLLPTPKSPKAPTPTGSPGNHKWQLRNSTFCKTRTAPRLRPVWLAIVRHHKNAE